jgi:PHD/YefM family antitoxin component YafN of YafNO toxin-antitoxin module
MASEPDVRSISSTADELRLIAARFAAEGARAEPVVFGRGGRPEAIIISVEQFLTVADQLDSLLSAEEVRRRLQQTAAAGGPVLSTLEQLAADTGVRPDLLDEK